MPLGAGASAARVAADSPTLSKIELSSSLIADHSLGEYGEALDTLAIRPDASHLTVGARGGKGREGAGRGAGLTH